MIETYDKYDTSILGVQEVVDFDVNKYGIVDSSSLDYTTDLHPMGQYIQDGRKDLF